MFIISSNYTEIAEADTLAEAKKIAITQSYKYDDIVRIDKGGIVAYIAINGALYAVRQTH